MNNTAKLSILLTMFLVLSIGCNYLRSAEPVASEQADAKPVETVKTGKLTLNNEPFGSLENPSLLNEKLEQIFKERETNGVFREDTNEIVRDIYVLADPKISLGNLAGISLHHGDLWFPRGNFVDQPDVPVKPNPLMLVIKTENPQNRWFKYGLMSAEELAGLASRAQFRMVETRKELAVKRVSANSLEISSDDHFFINSKTSKEISGEDDLKADQRGIGDSELRSELATLYKPLVNTLGPPGNFELTLIASENASYASLLKVLAAIDKPNVLVKIEVRPRTFKEK